MTPNKANHLIYHNHNYTYYMKIPCMPGKLGADIIDNLRGKVCGEMPHIHVHVDRRVFMEYLVDNITKRILGIPPTSATGQLLL